MTYYRDKLWVEGAIQHRNKDRLAEFVRNHPDSEWFDRAHYYLRHDFKVAERDDENCSKCHQEEFLKNNHKSTNPSS